MTQRKTKSFVRKAAAGSAQARGAATASCTDLIRWMMSWIQWQRRWWWPWMEEPEHLLLAATVYFGSSRISSTNEQIASGLKFKPMHCWTLLVLMGLSSSPELHGSSRSDGKENMINSQLMIDQFNYLLQQVNSTTVTRSSTTRE